MTRRPTRSLICLVAGAAATAAAILPMEVAAAAATGGGTSWRINLAQIGTSLDYNKASTRARISADGQHACFQTAATNAVPNDAPVPASPDIFWTDFSNPSAPVTNIVSRAISGTPADKQSNFCEISGNGDVVVFSSNATNLIPGSSTSGVFVRNMTASPNVLKRVAGGERPVISDNGFVVAYNGLPTTSNAIWVALLDANLNVVRKTNLTNGANTGTDVESLRPEISGDGKVVVFASDLPNLDPTHTDTNGQRDIYRVNIAQWVLNGTTPPPPELVSVDKTGMAAGATSSRPGINGDGSVVSFQSNSGNIANAPTPLPNGTPDTNGSTDAFVRDYRGGTPTSYLVSYKKDGTLANAVGSRPQLDDSGNIVVFVSSAAQIVSADTNNKEDAFIRNWWAEKQAGSLATAANRHAFLLAVAPDGSSGVCPGVAGTSEGTKAISTRPYLSKDGKTAIFITADCNLAGAGFGGPDANLFADIYVRRYPSI
jgi:hypothetical protein